MILETPRLRLQPPQIGDLDAIAAMWGSAEGGQYMPDPSYQSGAEIAEILEDDPDCPCYYFVATPAGGDEMVATCSLGLENAVAQEYSIGYNVAKAHWGKGYAGEMVQALIGFAQGLGIQSITAPIAKANHASIRVVEKCGFVVAGESSFKKSGTDIVHPTFIYRLKI